VIWANRRALHQILLKLANKALKFTDKGNVQIHVTEMASKSEPMAEFAVTDTGRGIRQEDQDKLRQAFTQVDAPGNRYGGTQTDRAGNPCSAGGKLLGIEGELNWQIY
jgi:two-component system sensor histidine kinase/response regulator